MANPIYRNVTATGTYNFWPDWAQTPFDLSYAVEFAAGTTGSYTVNFTLDDPNDTTWTPIWFPDPVNTGALTASKVGSYLSPIRGLQVIFSAIGVTALIRIAILQGISPG